MKGERTVKWRFAIEGPLLGYRASMRRAFDPKYKAFKERVGWLAIQAGIPTNLDPKEVRVALSVFVYWKNKPRIDWSNVYKAVEDGLFTQDRYIQPGGFNGFNCKARPEECAEVVVEVE